MILPVILAGGTGSRLWPLSRELYPKQFLNVAGESSMLQQTLSRLAGLDVYAPLIVCNEEHRFIAAEQIRQAGFDHSGILLEPVGRNTAPAIALAALYAKNRHPDTEVTLLVLAADHHISDVSAFQHSVRNALLYAQKDKLVTFGITPTKAETGYGYIKQGAKLDLESNTPVGIFDVERFVEKPNKATAQSYLDSKEYFWNSGMFLFKASQYLNELENYSPAIFDVCNTAIQSYTSDLDFIRIDRKQFELCPSDSIDYAVMEKTSHSVVVSMDAGWNDIGSWSALWEVSPKDHNGNVAEGDVICVNSKNNHIHSENKLVATVGIENLIVVETKDAILVSTKEQVQNVKTIVQELDNADRSEHLHHREVYRPWGKYDVIDNGQRDRVKRITVKPGHKLSLQMHHHRAEHWVVVAGIAKVKNGEQTLLISEDQSTYIPLGHIHSLENPGLIPLEMIEVQTGSYLSEDDIIRYDDQYGRTNNPSINSRKKI